MDEERGQDAMSQTEQPRTVTLDPETGEIISESRPAPESNVVALDDSGLPTKCNGTNRRGTPCGRAPVPGAAVCHYHGGAAPQVREKAAERIAQARDMALERLIEFFADDGDIADPKVLLEAVTKLTTQFELLSGRATQRTEVDERVHFEQIRVDLIARLDDLHDRHQKGIQRDDSPEALPESSSDPVPVEAEIVE